jgi:hypothetical protein
MAKERPFRQVQLRKPRDQVEIRLGLFGQRTRPHRVFAATLLGKNVDVLYYRGGTEPPLYVFCPRWGVLEKAADIEADACGPALG